MLNVLPSIGHSFHSRSGIRDVAVLEGENSTRSLVAFGGWSSVRDRTNRKRCPSHEMWLYEGDGR